MPDLIVEPCTNKQRLWNNIINEELQVEEYRGFVFWIKLYSSTYIPYRVMEVDNTNITAQKVYFPRDDTVKVHQNRVKPCQGGFIYGWILLV